MQSQPPTSVTPSVLDGLFVGAAAALVAWTAPSPVRSPDGLEMVGSMLAGGFDLAFWPPLWALLAAGATAVAGPELGPWLLDVGAAVLATLPIAWLGLRLGGGVGLRLAAGAWAILPAVSANAAVLDARPLTWLLVALAGALVAEGCHRERAAPWLLALALGGMGALVRPELLAMVPVTVAVALLLGSAAGIRRTVAAGAGLVALLPAVGLRVVAGDAGVAWQGFWQDVAGAWTPTDFVALHGAGSAGTPYRHFVDQVIAAGLEQPPAGGLLGLEGLGERLGWLGLGLAESVGVLLCLLALAGGTLQLDLRRRLVGVLVLGPLLALVLVEKAWGQMTLSATVLWATPLIVAAAGRGLRVLLGARGRRGVVVWIVPALVVAFVGLETRLGPARMVESPTFIEDAPAMDEAAMRLARSVPAGQPIACTITGRGLARRAGLTPVALPTRWEAWSPPPGTVVLLTSADLQGEDGGRGLELLRDPGWTLRGSAGRGPAPGMPAGDWALWLERRGS